MAARRRRPVKTRGLAPALAACAVILAVVAFAATNAVPATNAGLLQSRVTPNDLKPAACAGVTVTTMRVVSGVFNGTNADELILGSPGIDTIDGRAGTDCVLGGDGADLLQGGGQIDVCIGGPDIDVFHTSCETQIQ
jgi:Ca2+-binding RTX toxin-like protein